MSLTSLTALSPVDGRYASRCAELRAIFGESGLIRARVRVEMAWLQALAGPSGLAELRELAPADLALAAAVATEFGEADATAVKAIERETNHDVKAVEYFIKRKLGAHAAWQSRLEFVHFACTSEDINNLSYGLMCREARDAVLLPRLDLLANALRAMAHAHAEDAMMSRTHGQPATPTTLGKEVAVFVHRLRQAREAMGGVNLRAEEEMATLAAERDGHPVAHGLVLAAIARLRQAITSLNREGRERLLAAFTAVNGHFVRLFTHLFGGGEARLELTAADDPFDAGLEIMARPPCKKLATLSLLSGGEQALTALALLFAVFLVNPAPICVLDEVDAPLDDANVERFCNLVQELAEASGTRFLVITHHRLTMSRMDRLYGVTMIEKGVSQLVSVDLQEIGQLRAAS
jgi:hypothetical protein